MRRLFGSPGAGLFVVPLDHSVSDGPVATASGFRELVAKVVGSGADAVIVHKGRLRFLDAEVVRAAAMIVHLSASTSVGPDPDDKVLVTTVEEAVRAGADAVSVHVNLGSTNERGQLMDLGMVANRCREWGMPLLAMVYPRGPGITNGCEPRLVRHAATVAADLGADLVKVPYTGSPETMADVVAHCPIPVLAAGGAYAGDQDHLEVMVEDVMISGAAGVAVGRNVFAAEDPAHAARRVASIVHGELRPRRFGPVAQGVTKPAEKVSAV